MLEVTGLCKRFGGLKAIDGVTLSVATGEIRGVIGPNGAGKSTLFNLITGKLRPDAGQVRFAGTDVTRWPAHRIAAHGLVRVFQRPQLFPEMTVLDNVMTGMHRLHRGHLLSALLRPGWAQREEAAMRAAAEEVLAALDLGDLAGRPAGQLTFGQQRFVEVARALAARPRLLLLDEPFTGMTGVESGRMLSLLRRLNGEGLTVVVIDHNMSLIFELCQQVSVLHFGQLIAAGTPAEVRADPTVIDAYLGGGVARHAAG